LEQVVVEVFASSPPQAQKQMLVRLVDKVYETGPAPLQGLDTNDHRPLRPAEAVAMVKHAMHTGGGAVARLSRALMRSPSLAGSGAATVLVGLLRSTYRRRASDRAKTD
jgi:hypothetical protein